MICNEAVWEREFGLLICSLPVDHIGIHQDESGVTWDPGFAGDKPPFPTVGLEPSA